MKLQPAVKAETKRMAMGTTMCVCAMYLIVFVLHLFLADFIPFDYTVILGGLGGGLVAVLNFFLLAVTVQQIANDKDEDIARKRMANSHSKRLLMQGVWIVIAIVAPCFWWPAGILPLLFPRFTIHILQITGQYKPEKKGGET